MDSTQLIQTSACLGFTGAFFYSGIALCSAQIALPILYSLPTEHATAAFTNMYYRAVPIVAPLGVGVATCLGTAAYLDPSRRTAYAIAAAFGVSPLPFTAIVLAATNNQLIAMSKDATVREKVGRDGMLKLFKFWKAMTLLRSGMVGTGAVIGLLAFLGKI